MFAPFGAIEEPDDVDDYDPSHCVCPECKAVYSGTDKSGGHCRGGIYGGCCQSFASQHAADKHFVFARDGLGLLIRCRTPEEMRAKGWTCDETGAWRTPPPKQPFWKGSE